MMAEAMGTLAIMVEAAEAAALILLYLISHQRQETS
jgi:hypothetical protein